MAATRLPVNLLPKEEVIHGVISLPGGLFDLTQDNKQVRFLLAKESFSCASIGGAKHEFTSNQDPELTILLHQL
jgi:hypothetical protein